ncbi:YrhB domain-containing protein [Streptomyces tagetis]|uniref:Immunity protein 35 domain-containing protein n=1 Tax=Streptomyces tagetis TaxID=2820809 RepID=A0A940XE50_9ACTN|nr:YrhB domain-containing protein [Streptomyces sp. RG38]MBQ0826770.1 hypothetical protein [Streptomyces sp. RG38]
MVERETAVRAVTEELDRAYRQARAAGADPERGVVTHAVAHPLVWIVHGTSEAHARTGDPRRMPVGHGPYLVDRTDGGLHTIGAVAAASGRWEDDHRARVRGLPVRTAVDDLHDELRASAATRGRAHAGRLLRHRVPGLSPAETVAYVHALHTGGTPAAHLVARVAAHVVPAPDPVLSVRTVRRG